MDADKTAHGLAVDEQSSANGDGSRPRGIIYRPVRVFGRKFWYASPKVQLLMVSLVCFLCPGMYNSLTGLGGGGQVDATAQDHANVALYSTFAVVSFLSGSFANRLGLRLTLSIGGLGYCIYSASFLSYSHTGNVGFVIFAGAFLGLCAGLLWTAQGAIMMSYPPENSKGRYISWFWIIFNLGAVIGSLIPLAENINKKAGPVTDGTYIAFIVLMFLGACLSLMLCDADKVIRDDNTKVILMKNPSWSSELKGLWATLFNEPWILLLFPMFFASNFFYTYQNNGMNAAHFNTRTRALNNLLYWLAQIFGAVVTGHCLDLHSIRRSLRARLAFGFLAVLTFVTWGAGWHWQMQQVTRVVAESKDYHGLIDWTDGSRFAGAMVLYFFYGFYDAIWQTCIYWFMGSLSNSGRKAANLAGFYKSIQSFGASIAYYMDGSKKEYNTIFGVTWGLLAGSLVFALPVVLYKIKDHVPVEDDLKFSDETIDDVIVGPGEKEKTHPDV
ncbi:membrane protein [Ophiocordyceps camponoti-floridani]|uniref:Membrane protein n=1 Tax=Ophiocordyceps camponoti-floridani TaxID=2030778 RepID=A0A8H4Q9E9_9HYPO|nr:membrane protein [Ophiocordyceps camponoti-floridani]